VADGPVPDADVFEAIASPVRRQILDLLRRGEQPVHELAASFAMTRPAVSQHLRVLRAAGLVREERAGRERRYRLDARPLRAVLDWAAHYEQFWQQHARSLSELLDERD
jgi:DNA-binding transcriptional ArsR family regulator